MKEIPLQMNDKKLSNLIIDFTCMKEILAKVKKKKSILNNPLQFSVLEIHLKIYDITKINSSQFYNRNPFKTDGTQKKYKSRITRKKASQAV